MAPWELAKSFKDPGQMMPMMMMMMMMMMRVVMMRVMMMRVVMMTMTGGSMKTSKNPSKIPVK